MKEFTVKDFLTLILFFQLQTAINGPNNTIDEKALGYLKTAAEEKFSYWCAQYGGGNCTGVSDNAVFNYVATRGAAWIRYDAYVAHDKSIPSYPDRPTKDITEDPFSTLTYESIASIADFVYANAKGQGSLWDWGNQAGGEMNMFRSDIGSAPIGSGRTDVIYRNVEGNFYILNADQANYWATK